MPIWSKEFETMPRTQLKTLQLGRLQDMIDRVAHHSSCYQTKFAEADIAADDIRHLEDINKLPFTTKEELRCSYPWGTFAVPRHTVVRLHASSGTTGKPIVGGYTRNDLKLWADLMARTLSTAGITADDVVHNSHGYGLFTGGMGFHMGVEEIGATAVPVATGLLQRQLMLLEDFEATVLACTPSYALVIAEEALAQGINVRERFKLRIGTFGAEPWTEKMRDEIESLLHIKAHDVYGLTEMIGPGVAVECECQEGLHIAEDHFYPEIIDPFTGEPLGFGVEGELVLTALTREAMPILRYRTRDRTTLHAEKCGCGRTLVRMEKVLGRTDDMLIVRGVNVFPSQIERVLLEFSELEPHYQIIVDRGRHELDSLAIWVEGVDSLFLPVDTARIAILEKEVERRMRDTLVINCTVKLMKPHTIERSRGKAVRVVDKRRLDGWQSAAQESSMESVIPG